MSSLKTQIHPLSLLSVSEGSCWSRELSQLWDLLAEEMSQKEMYLQMKALTLREKLENKLI